MLSGQHSSKLVTGFENILGHSLFTVFHLQMTSTINHYNRVIEIVNLISSSQRSHGLTVAEGFLTHRIGFLVFFHHNLGIAG